MGYSWEVDLHFYMKRAWALAGAWGDRSFHARRVQALVCGAAFALGPDQTFDELLEDIDVQRGLYRRRGAQPRPARRRATLAAVHAADLGAHAIKRAAASARGVDPAQVDDVVFGCVDQLGAQAGDIARTCWLAAGCRTTCPAPRWTGSAAPRSRRCISPRRRVMSGTQDLVVAGGVQTMNQIPISAAMVAGQVYGQPDPFSGSSGWRARYGTQEVSQFRCRRDDRRQVGHHAARRWRSSRWRATGARSSRSAQAATSQREIAPLNGLDHDETPRARDHAREDGDAGAAVARRPHHRGRLEPDRRCGGGAADRLRSSGAPPTDSSRAPASTICRCAARIPCGC